MRVIENKTVYKCDYCGKKLFVKKSMELHEKWCGKNPDNIKACVGCIHLEEIEISYDVNRNAFGEEYGIIFDAYTETVKTKGFRCNKLNKKLYPLKVEKNGLPDKYPETFDDQEPMPNTCEFTTPFKP